MTQCSHPGNVTLTHLVDSGRVNLDDDVSKYYSGVINRENFDHPVTIKDLLTHTTGFDQIGLSRQIGNFTQTLKQRKSLRPSLVGFLDSDNVR